MNDEKAPFNSALDLLERLSNILTQITKVKQVPMLNKDLVQGYVLKLTKDYYIQSIPLLSETARKDLKPILDLEQKEMEIIIDKKLSGRKKTVYTKEVEDKINDTLIKIQMDLQDVGKYFMPPRRDRGRAVAEF